MGPTDWPVLSVTRMSQQAFVLYWDALYSVPDERFYQTNIGRPVTDDELVRRWFEWKNGLPLSARKLRTARLIAADEPVGEDADAETLEVYLNRPGGVVWRTFWLHVQRPRHFPIYDQHVHRAMAFLLGRDDREIPAGNRAKAKCYLGSYRPFFRRFEGHDHRQVDRALWAFGRFLKSGFGKLKLLGVSGGTAV